MTAENNITEKKNKQVLDIIKNYGPKTLIIAGALTGTTGLVIVGLAAFEYVNIIKDSSVAKLKNLKNQQPK